MTDRLTPQQRSSLMAKIKGKDTKVEVILRSELHKKGLRFRKNVKGLPGTPDILFVKKKIAVFVDGDFWHGFGFKKWKHKLTPFWKQKIEKNIQRDKSNYTQLNRKEWKVIRIWGHQIKNDLNKQLERILNLTATRK